LNYQSNKTQELLFKAYRVIEFRHPNVGKYYVCYINSSSHIVLFEWLKKTSAEVLPNDVFDFIIRKIISGYKIAAVIKSRDGKQSIKDNIFEKYYRLLYAYYHTDEALDAYFRQFIYAVLTADVEGLRLIMIDINTHLGQFS